MVLIIPIFLILLLNIGIFVPFFNLGLFGDDWLTVFRYSYYLDLPQHLGTYSTEYFNNFKYLFNAYGTQDTLMSLLYKSYGENSNIYFIVSYFLRVIAGFSIYLPALYLTKSRITSLFAVFFFMFSTAGLEASGWVFNMPSYLNITFLSVFLYFYLRSHYEKKNIYLFLSYPLFFLTFSSTLIRSHPLIPFVILLEIFWLTKDKSWRETKLAFIRIMGFLFIFLLIYFFGFKETISGNALISLHSGLITSLNFLSQGRFDFIFYPVVTLGSLVIPESFVPQGWNLTSIYQYLLKIFIPIFCLYMIATVILAYSVKNLGSKFLLYTSSLAILWGMVVAITYRLNISTFATAKYVSLFLIGGYLINLVVILFTLVKTNEIIKDGLIIGLGWILLSYFLPGWTNPHFIYTTTHRYLITSSFGLSLLLATIIGIGKNTKNIFLLFLIGGAILLLHTLSTRNYLERLYQTHSRETVEKIWSKLSFIPEVGQSAEPLVLYFEGDGSNESIIGDSITFGFPPHMALIYKIKEENLMPIAMNSWRDVESAITDGKSFAPNNRPLKPIPINRVYAFHLQGKDNLIDITIQARKKLMELNQR